MGSEMCIRDRYELYTSIDSNCLRTKLVNIILEDSDNSKQYEMLGFAIEDEESYQNKRQASFVETPKLKASALHRACFFKMLFFQYMIANTDWSVKNQHNLKFVQLSEEQKPTAMPYDFDYSGFVGYEYSSPHPIIPIESVHERFFFPQYKSDTLSIQKTRTYFLSIENDIYSICDQAHYMKPEWITESKAYLTSFFEQLKSEEEYVFR